MEDGRKEEQTYHFLERKGKTFEGWGNFLDGVQLSREGKIF